MTRAEQARELGVSVRHLRRLLARERREAEERAGHADPDQVPHMVLTDDPARERGHWYDLNSDETSIDQGRVLIGADGHHGESKRSRRLPGRRLEGRLRIQDLTKGYIGKPSGPTTYDPADDGLKGGKDS